MRHQRKALDHRSKEQNLRAGLLALTQQGVAYDIARDYIALRIQQHQCLHTLHRHLGSDYRDYAPNSRLRSIKSLADQGHKIKLPRYREPGEITDAAYQHTQYDWTKTTREITLSLDGYCQAVDACLDAIYNIKAYADGKLGLVY